MTSLGYTSLVLSIQASTASFSHSWPQKQWT